MDTPLRFVPFLRPMVWGGRRLGRCLGKPLPTAEPYGESWEVSDHPLHRSVVASRAARRPDAAPSAWRQTPGALLGPAAAAGRRLSPG